MIVEPLSLGLESAFPEADGDMDAYRVMEKEDTGQIQGSSGRRMVT